MDLLGRKARARANELERYLSWTTQRSNWAIAKLQADVDSRSRLISDLIFEVDLLKAQLAVLQTPAPKPSFRPSQALHMSEEEQELRWREEQGLIKRSELEAALEQLDFENTEIELDPDYPRNNLTY